MKKRNKGIIMFLFLGGIMVTSGVVIAIPGVLPNDNENKLTITGTPADNYPDSQRERFCGTEEAKSNAYVTEYRIPTECTQPLAITTDSKGDIWFAQTNTGNVGKFNPQTKMFEEYENPNWPEGARSMMWGMAYSPDNSIWFTDDAFNLIWKFTIPDKKYKNLNSPVGNQSLPQKIQVSDSTIIFNDSTSGVISVMTPSQNSAEFLLLPPLLNNSFASDFTLDGERNIWYSLWRTEGSGLLIKFDYQNYTSNSDDLTYTLLDFFEYFSLPEGVKNTSGITHTSDGRIWFTDNESSFFYVFNTNTTQYTKLITSKPSILTYGNVTGAIINPLSGPLWVDSTNDGKIVFNEQAANRIAVFDPLEQSLVEYNIPSKNPNWADCNGQNNCGLAQVFDFVIQGDKVWFTEWAENKIGVVDISKELPFEVKIREKSMAIQIGKNETISMTIKSHTSGTFDIEVNNSGDSERMEIIPEIKRVTLSPNEEYEIPILIEVSEDMPTGYYPVSIGLQNEDVSISQNVVIQVATLVFKIKAGD